MKPVVLSSYAVSEADHHTWFQKRGYRPKMKTYTKEELWQLRADLISGRILTQEEQLQIVEAFLDTRTPPDEQWRSLRYASLRHSRPLKTR